MNAAIKLLAFVGQSAQRGLDIITHRDVTTGDLIAARRILIGMRADLDEAEQRIRAEIDRHRKIPSLVPDRASITDREVDQYADKLHEGLGGDPIDHELVDSFATVESPDRAPLNRPCGHRFPRGRYTFDLRSLRLVAASGTLTSPGRKA